MVPEGWRKGVLEDIAIVTSGGTPSRGVAEYWCGSIPWVTTSEVNFCEIYDSSQKITDEGLNNSSAKMFPVGTILMAMYGQGKTRGQVAKLAVEAATNQACAAILLKLGYDSDFYFQYLQSQYSNIRQLSNGGGQDNLSGTIVKSIPVPIAPQPEQRKIAKILGTWDKAITTTEQLLTNSQQQKKALMQQLLTGKRRLLGFQESSGFHKTRYGLVPDDWGFVGIEDVAIQIVKKNSDGLELPVLSCSKYDGFVDSLKYFKKKVYSDDTSTYKVVERNSFGFPSNHIEEGSIGYQDLYDSGVVSPIYTVFKTNEMVHDGYLYKLLKTDHYRQIFAASTNASVDRRGSLRWKEFSKIKIPLPSFDEQSAISEVIQSAEDECQILKKRVKALKQEKKALMQQLLTGKRRVTIEENTPD
ncbi:restriction endonuclease subunit S [Endozoicomonas sp. 4G]|uniref:restriction endonuclease subunit S n=1 Tax=Endozoicomonas sp. 4G TaxID=2872754 RepID=UPI002078F451|nr:restriction endonuclease subunit S [Endozoicomonas sp. 4G]